MRHNSCKMVWGVLMKVYASASWSRSIAFPLPPRYLPAPGHHWFASVRVQWFSWFWSFTERELSSCSVWCPACFAQYVLGVIFFVLGIVTISVGCRLIYKNLSDNCQNFYNYVHVIIGYAFWNKPAHNEACHQELGYLVLVKAGWHSGMTDHIACLLLTLQQVFFTTKARVPVCCLLRPM